MSVRESQSSADYLTPEAQALIDKARALVPRLAERAARCEADGKVPEETIRELDESGLLRILQPKRWGGFEMDPRVFYTVQMTLAEGCASTAWVFGVMGVHYWQLPLFPEQAQQDVWGKDPATHIASTYMPVGKAEKVEGGYRFSGHWGFSSGCEHAQWAFLGGLLPTPDGKSIEHATFLVPRADFRIVKNWDVLGLRGTGSHDIVVENAFVPEHRTQRTNNHTLEGCPGRAVNPGWLYRIPFTQVFQRAVSTAALGALYGAIDAFAQRSATHIGKHGGKTAEDPNAQLAVAEAMMVADEQKLVLLRNFEPIVEAAKHSTEMDVEARLLQRAQSARVTKVCARELDDLLRACAGQGLYKNNAIERFFRDTHQARGHIANNADAYARAYGAVRLGLPNMDPFV
ncbi:MAG: flavin-dependent monooxygenase [Nevskiaceae bacterium]|nr:MAG: flavin-dependent monooxygenase [Nevskiaceae bacterium]TBR74752.1 MAG: flavin-dependent monooxygenase [Nevskiaceae bacterium]